MAIFDDSQYFDEDNQEGHVIFTTFQKSSAMYLLYDKYGYCLRDNIAD